MATVFHDTSADHKWSTAANWSDGVPDSTDAVTVDTDVTSLIIDATANCLSFDATGTAGITISGSSIFYCYGDFKLDTNVTWEHTGSFSILINPCTFTTAEVNMSSVANISFRSGADVSLVGTLTMTAKNCRVYGAGSSLTTNNNSITCAIFTDDGQAGAITAASINADAITNAKIADNAIAAENLAADCITNAKIADNAIAAENIAADAITAAKIANGAIDAATFAADVDAEILSYLVDDATRIDASALNTAAVTTIPAILEDTGTTIPGTITTIDNEIAVIDGIVDNILLDTAELQTDWVNGGRLDLLLDGAASAGDPWSTALPGAYGAGTAGLLVGTTIPNAIADIPTNAEFALRTLPSADYTVVTDLGVVQTGDSFAIVNGDHGLVSIQDDVDAILADTNELQADDTPTAVAAVKTVVDAVKVTTDKFVFTVANQVDANMQSINDTALVGDGGATPWGP